jgi:hypothetical protein
MGKTLKPSVAHQKQWEQLEAELLGGHFALSSKLGLGVDNVQQLRLVLSNGTYVTDNGCQNQDIFYALRGAGAFAVAMDLSPFVHPVQVCNSSFYGYNDTLTV